jgi:hypothetical protein
VVAAKKVVIAPINVVASKATGAYSNNGEHLAISPAAAETPRFTVQKSHYIYAFYLAA